MCWQCGPSCNLNCDINCPCWSGLRMPSVSIAYTLTHIADLCVLELWCVEPPCRPIRSYPATLNSMKIVSLRNSGALLRLLTQFGVITYGYLTVWPFLTNLSLTVDLRLGPCSPISHLRLTYGLAHSRRFLIYC
jgi:hypothetical protein